MKNGYSGFSETHLEQMARHVKYEIDEYRRSMQELSGPRKPEWNRTLESVLLHFRVLRGFFFGGSSRRDNDVFASHYIDGWNPVRNEIFSQTKDAIDKRLAHLTIERLQNSSWVELDAMKGAMEGLILTFKNALPSSRKQWFMNLDTEVMTPSLGAADNSTQS